MTVYMAKFLWRKTRNKLRGLLPGPQTVIHRWRRKICGANYVDNHVWLKIVFVFCLFTCSACILLTVISLGHEPIDLISSPPQERAADRMLGLALHPELQALPGDNFKIWPYEVTNINYNWTLSPKNPCQGDVLLVLFVHTRPHFTESRRAIRETWGSVSRTGVWPRGSNSVKPLPKVQVFFVTAQSRLIPSVTQELEEEQRQFNDIIMWNFDDSYFNLTLKSIMELKWFVDFCPKAQYVAKADDDVFIDIGRLVDLLERESYLSNTIIGDLMRQPKVYRDHPKWGMSPYRFSDKYYPNYMKGTTYIITADLPSKLVTIAPYVLPIHIDDVYITGILAKILNVHLVKNSSFRVLEKLLPDPCLLHSLGKIVTLGTANPLTIKYIEEKESQQFQYDLWKELKEESHRWRCMLQGPYWHLVNAIL